MLGVYVGPLPARNGAVRLFRLVCPPPRPSSPRRPLVPRPSIVDGQIARFLHCRDTMSTPIRFHPDPAGHDRRSIGSAPAAGSWPCSLPGSHNLKYPKPTGQLQQLSSIQSSPGPVQASPSPVQSSPPQSRLPALHLGPRQSRSPPRIPRAKFHAYCTDCDGEAGNVTWRSPAMRALAAAPHGAGGRTLSHDSPRSASIRK